MVNLLSAVRKDEIVTGTDAAESLFDNRLIVPLDPGCTNLAGAVFAYGVFGEEGFEGSFKRHIFSAREFKRSGGVDARIDSAAENTPDKMNAAKLSVDHARTVEDEAIARHWKTFAEVEKEMMKNANSRGERRELARTKRKQQRYWMSLVNLILAFDDDMSNSSDKAPVILFGILSSQ